MPEHWERRRLKTLLRVVDRRSSTVEKRRCCLCDETTEVVVYSEHFAGAPQGRSRVVGYKQLAVGQLVINRLQRSRPTTDIVFCSGVDGLVSPDYSVSIEKTASVQMKYLSDLSR